MRTKRSPLIRKMKDISAELRLEIQRLRKEEKLAPSTLACKFRVSKTLVKRIINEMPESIRKKRNEYIKGIYMIKNEVNGKMYIGQSKNILHRWSQHIDAIMKEKSPLYLEMREVGLEAFSWRILISHPNFTPRQLNKLECTFISYFHTMNPKFGYNQKYTAGYNPYKIDLQGLTVEKLLDIVFAEG